MDARYETTGYETVDKYRLIAPIGSGGMATVHLAVMSGSAGFNKLVVVKRMHAQYAADPEVLAMFLREARLTARLSHPNVVQTSDYWQEGDRPCIAMEFLDGQPLDRILRRLASRGGLPLPMHLAAIADVLAGLHYAHELTDYDDRPLGIIHRDVSPQNIFVTYDGVVKVVDFGIAKAADSSVHTAIGVLKGKVAYMAPEQARGEEVDRRADIFAVGVMLWEAVTGARPWPGLSERAIVKCLWGGEFPSARALAPDLPPQLEAILLKALASDREDRYATAAELRSDIEAYLEATGRRPTANELGKLVSMHFDAERASMRTLLREQLRGDDAPASGPAPRDPVAPPAEERVSPEDCPTTPIARPRWVPPRSDASVARAPIVALDSTPSTSIQKSPPTRRAAIGSAALASGVVMIACMAVSAEGTPAPVLVPATHAALEAPSRSQDACYARFAVEPARAVLPSQPLHRGEPSLDSRSAGARP